MDYDRVSQSFILQPQFSVEVDNSRKKISVLPSRNNKIFSSILDGFVFLLDDKHQELPEKSIYMADKVI